MPAYRSPTPWTSRGVAAVDGLSFDRGFAAVPAAVCAVDRDFRYLAMNERWAKLASIPSGVGPGRKIGDFDVALAESLHPYLPEALAGRRCDDIPLTFSSGTRQGALAPLLEDGVAVGASILVHMLPPCPSTATGLTNPAVDVGRPMAVTDQAGDLLFLSDAATQLFGGTADDFLGKPFTHFFTDDGVLIDAAAMVSQALQSVVPIKMQGLAQRKDGACFLVEATLSRATQPDRFLVIFTDLSEQSRRLQEVLRFAEDKQSEIARELHDRAGQDLTALNLLTYDLREGLDGHPVAAGMEELSHGIEELFRWLQDLSRRLRPAEVDDWNLGVAVEALADDVERKRGVRCAAECPLEDFEVPRGCGAHLLRIAEDVVDLAIERSLASELRLRLQPGAGGALTLTIDFDGVDPGPLAEHKEIQYRAALLGAVVRVTQLFPSRRYCFSCQMPMECKQW